MEPTLKNGDIVFFKRYLSTRNSIKIDEIIIFNHPLKDIKLIKRVKNVNECSIEVYGDNKDSSNDSESFGFIQKKSVLGIVTSRISLKPIAKLKYTAPQK